MAATKQSPEIKISSTVDMDDKASVSVNKPKPKPKQVTSAQVPFAVANMVARGMTLAEAYKRLKLKNPDEDII